MEQPLQGQQRPTTLTFHLVGHRRQLPPLSGWRRLLSHRPLGARIACCSTVIAARQGCNGRARRLGDVQLGVLAGVRRQAEGLQLCEDARIEVL
jgi:hypothetical protein